MGFQNLAASSAQLCTVSLQTGKEGPCSCIRLDVTTMFSDIGAACSLLLRRAFELSETSGNRSSNYDDRQDYLSHFFS